MYKNEIFLNRQEQIVVIVIFMCYNNPCSMHWYKGEVYACNYRKGERQTP